MHISQLADRFVKDPNEVVKVGDIVRVRVTEVDIPRKRIGLTMRKDGGAQEGRKAGAQSRGPSGNAQKPRQVKPAPRGNDQNGSFGTALMDAMWKR